MGIELRHSFVACAVMFAACDFTGLPDDRARYTTGPHRDAGASLGADATTGADACVAESDGALAERLCGARVCGTVQGTDNCGATRSVSCGSCGASQACSAAGACDCAGESTPQLVNANCGVGSCGDKVVTDRCGGSRTINCGSTCAGTGQTCGGGEPSLAAANVCGCTPESALAFCTRYGKDCGTISAADNCGNLRSNVACGTCTAPQTCAGGGVVNVCGCTPSTCAALGANCDSVGDGCGGTLSCGTCSGIGVTCGGAGTPNVCGCTPESESSFCSRLGVQCGSTSGTDNCGNARSVANCGGCSGTGQTCGGGNPGAPNVCGCTPESNAVFCTRLGAECGTKTAADNCGQARTVASCGSCTNNGACSAQNLCSWVASTGELGARSAAMSGDGVSDCGAVGNESCATSPLVSGGTFYRGTDTANPATISDFRLDKYEVTVGRFRKFVDAWVGGWRPSAGSGKHTHLNGGSGLANTAGGNEPGWDATWTAYVGAPSNGAVAPTGVGATTNANWDTNLSCDSSYQPWTSAAGGNEKRPQNCLSWYDLHAFCIWDGGFLPSEAEWEYAAAGGSEERTYAWGNTAPGANTALAIYGCYYNGSGSCSGVSNIATVGTVAAGAGKWGQLDLAGNVFEWNLDWYQSPHVAQCNNCTNLTAGSFRVFRGGSFSGYASGLPAAYRFYDYPASRSALYGGRCARSP